MATPSTGLIDFDFHEIVLAAGAAFGIAVVLICCLLLRRTTRDQWLVIGCLCVIVTICVVVPIISGERIRRSQTSALSNITQIALALRIYAADHHGALPNSLDELFPKYISQKFMRDHPVFLAPGANLDNLSGKSVLLRATDGEGFVTEVRADMGGTAKKP